MIVIRKRSNLLAAYVEGFRWKFYYYLYSSCQSRSSSKFDLRSEEFLETTRRDLSLVEIFRSSRTLETLVSSSFPVEIREIFDLFKVPAVKFQVLALVVSSSTLFPRDTRPCFIIECTLRFAKDRAELIKINRSTRTPIAVDDNNCRNYHQK